MRTESEEWRLDSKPLVARKEGSKEISSFSAAGKTAESLLPRHYMTALQRTIGNAAICRLMSHGRGRKPQARQTEPYSSNGVLQRIIHDLATKKVCADEAQVEALLPRGDRTGLQQERYLRLIELAKDKSIHFLNVMDYFKAAVPVTTVRNLEEWSAEDRTPMTPKPTEDGCSTECGDPFPVTKLLDEVASETSRQRKQHKSGNNNFLYRIYVLFRVDLQSRFMIKTIYVESPLYSSGASQLPATGTPDATASDRGHEITATIARVQAMEKEVPGYGGMTILGPNSRESVRKYFETEGKAKAIAQLLWHSEAAALAAQSDAMKLCERAVEEVVKITKMLQEEYKHPGATATVFYVGFIGSSMPYDICFHGCPLHLALLQAQLMREMVECINRASPAVRRSSQYNFSGNVRGLRSFKQSIPREEKQKAWKCAPEPHYLFIMERAAEYHRNRLHIHRHKHFKRVLPTLRQSWSEASSATQPGTYAESEQPPSPKRARLNSGTSMQSKEPLGTDVIIPDSQPTIPGSKPTSGEGLNCLLHALFGERNESGEYKCVQAPRRRKLLVAQMRSFADSRSFGTRNPAPGEYRRRLFNAMRSTLVDHYLEALNRLRPEQNRDWDNWDPWAQGEASFSVLLRAYAEQIESGMLDASAAGLVIDDQIRLIVYRVADNGDVVEAYRFNCETDIEPTIKILLQGNHFTRYEPSVV